MSNLLKSEPKPARYSVVLIVGGLLIVAVGFGAPRFFNSPNTETAAANSGNDQAATTPAPIQPPSATGIGASLLRLMIGLAVIGGLCVLAARRFAPKRADSSGAMEVLGSIAVARSVIHLVRAGERKLLVGTDMSGAKAILELPVSAPEDGTDGVISESTLVPCSEPPAPTIVQPTRDEIISILTRLRARPDASSPG